MRLRPRGLHASNVRIFSSASDAPAVRPPTDIVLLALALVVMSALSFPAPGPGTLDGVIANFVEALPGLLGWLWEISYDQPLGGRQAPFSRITPSTGREATVSHASEPDIPLAETLRA